MRLLRSVVSQILLQSHTDSADSDESCTSIERCVHYYLKQKNFSSMYNTGILNNISSEFVNGQIREAENSQRTQKMVIDDKSILYGRVFVTKILHVSARGTDVVIFPHLNDPKNGEELQNCTDMENPNPNTIFSLVRDGKSIF